MVRAAAIPVQRSLRNHVLSGRAWVLNRASHHAAPTMTAPMPATANPIATKASEGQSRPCSGRPGLVRRLGTARATNMPAAVMAHPRVARLMMTGLVGVVACGWALGRFGADTR